MPYRSDEDALAFRCATLEKQLAELALRTHELEALRQDEAALHQELAATRKLIAERRRKPSLPMFDDIKIAKPCNADWNAMQGDERVRFCGQCQKNVYNLSQMTREQGEALVREKEGSLCVRFYQRADGTLLTADCPVGLRRTRFRKLTAAAVGAGVLSAGLLWATAQTMGAPRPQPETMGKLAAISSPYVVAHPVMGGPAAPSPPRRPVARPHRLAPPPEPAMMGDLAAPRMLQPTSVTPSVTQIRRPDK